MPRVRSLRHCRMPYGLTSSSLWLGGIMGVVSCSLWPHARPRPVQDVRAHKAEHVGGFNARSIDTDVVVPLLREWGLANAGESHWLTQIFSGLAFTQDQKLKTQPKLVGEIVPRLVYEINAAKPAEVANVIFAILVFLIDERNKGRIPLTKPKGLTIDRAIGLLRFHFGDPSRQAVPVCPNSPFMRFTSA